MRFACLLADGFEDIEALGTVALLRRSGISVDLVNVMNQLTAKGSFTTEVVTDVTLKKTNAKDYDGLFIPGGRQAAVLRQDKDVLELVRQFAGGDKWLMAICAGPTIFGVLGLLDGKHYTSFPGTEEYMPKAIRENKSVVTDKKIITAIGAGAVYEFAFEIIKNIFGAQKQNELKKRILFREFE